MTLPHLPAFHSPTTAEIADRTNAINQLSTDLLAVTTPPMVVVRRLITQSINTATVTSVSYNTQLYDPQAMIVVPGTTVTLDRAGFWALQGGVQFAVNATGQRIMMLYHNGAEIDGGAQSVPGNATDLVRCNASTTIQAAAADTVTLEVYQTSGGALNIDEARLVVRYVST